MQSRTDPGKEQEVITQIALENIIKKYGDGFKAANDISLDITDGEFMVFVDPSGCGGSTTLHMIVRPEGITSRSLLIDGKTVNSLAPKDRDLVMIFQNYALCPHLTIRENIAFPLRLNRNRFSEQEIRRWVDQAAEMLELMEHLEYRPTNLSDGQQQHVAMGHMIVREANTLLFDEPLSNLDAKLRGQMYTEISRLQRQLGITTTYVTRDQTKAITLGDRVAVLERKVLQQCVSPRELYERPMNLFVTDFIGSLPMDFLPATVQGDHLEPPMATVPIPGSTRQGLAGRKVVIVGLRPERTRGTEVATPPAGTIVLNSVVDATEWLSNGQYAYVPFRSDPSVQNIPEELDQDLDGEGMRIQLVANLGPRPQILEGKEAELYFMPENMMVFGPESGRDLTRDEQNAQRVTERSEKARKRALERAKIQDDESSESRKEEPQ